MESQPQNPEYRYNPKNFHLYWRGFPEDQIKIKDEDYEFSFFL